MTVAALPLPTSAGALNDRSILEQLAATVGASDVLVFRQVHPGRFLQVGGIGRGAGWAGNIEVRHETEPDFCHTMAGSEVRMWEAGATRRIVGPYFAATAALVPIDHDAAVLFGASNCALIDDEGKLRAAAATALQLVEEISPSKTLADELKVLHAVRAVVRCRDVKVNAVLHHVAMVAAEALQCEVGVAWLPGLQKVAIADRGWSLRATEAEVAAALRTLDPPEAVCTQDSLTSPLPAPLSPEHGVRSHFIVPLGAPSKGLLVLLHTDAAPRGFTNLCRRVGEAAADAAGVLTHSALLREELERLLVSTRDAARMDWLTGVGNRLRWNEAMAAAQQAVSAGHTTSVLVMDLDRLKQVNDAFGHDAGDRYLLRAAKMLSDCAGPGAVVARIGGDEFAVLLPQDDTAAAPRLAGELEARLALEGGDPRVALSASVGWTLCPPGGDLADAMIRADGEMYAAKARQRIGRNCFQTLTRQTSVQTNERVELEHAMRRALEQGQFELHYQPQVGLRNGVITAVEALLRWKHPELGLVPPARFIPLAEDTGLILPLGEWVLRSACNQLKAWHAAGHRELSMAVNLSARQFQQRNLPEFVRRILEESGVQPSGLNLELTESALLQTSDAVIKTLRELKAMGITLALDDFGTGYSSLSYLQRFPIDVIKIDQSFTIDLASSMDAAPITRAILAMAHSLNMNTVAEGVETRQQFEFLRVNGCSAIQGHYFCPALPASEMTSVLASYRICDVIDFDTGRRSIPLTLRGAMLA
jgi:diguanylate cyclase (GGDEF)-like protein